MRGISTVLDVSLFLLLVSAAVGTLALAGSPSPQPPPSDETAELLATATATVEYDLRGTDRVAHGTLATLLARAAVANATVQGHQIATGSGFRRRVRDRTREALSDRNHTQIRARWVAYDRAPVSGEVTVGPSPPPGVDADATRLRVPASVEAVDAGAGSYRAFGRRIATAVVDRVAPAPGAVAVSRGRSPVSTVGARRYRRLGVATGVPVERALATGNSSTARRRVVSGLAELLAADAARRFESPDEAAARARTGTVRVIVRRWGP